MAGGDTSTRTAEPRKGSNSARVNIGVAALLLAHFVLANAATWNKSGTFDEMSHMANGYSCWATGDYRMDPLAILQHRWITLPLYLGNFEAPAPDGLMWKYADNWGYGRELCFGRVDPENPESDLKNDPQEMFHISRMMTSIWSVLCAWLVFVWARKLWGTAGGFVSLALYVFNPNILAHASSATIDLPAALAFTAAMYTLWNLLQRVTTARLAISSVVWALAICSKFSALLLVPMGLTLMLVRYLDGRPLQVDLPNFHREITKRVGLFPLFGVVVATHFLVIWITIWGMFGFRFATQAEGDPPMKPLRGGGDVTQFDYFMLDPSVQSSAIAPVLRTFHTLRLFPEAYLMCFANTISTVDAFNAYLNGRFGYFGFPSFFLYCVLYKTPISVFVIALLAMAAHFTRRYHQVRRLGRSGLSLFLEGFYVTSPLWAIIAFYWFTAITGHINIGVRHILPTFPATFILMGAAGAWLGGLGNWFGRNHDAENVSIDDAPEGGEPFRTVHPWTTRLIMKWATAACLAWFVLDVVFAFPNYLAYFNFFGGGTKNGYQHLVDSSYDWGQELPALRKWLEEHDLADPATRKRQVYLSYFGSTPPSAYGVHANLLPCFFDRRSLEPDVPHPDIMALEPGVYVISATMLQSVYTGNYCGPWRQDFEQKYRYFLNIVNTYFSAPPETQQQLLQQWGGIEVFRAALKEFDDLRLGRLCAYLRRHEPDDQINAGLLVYMLSQPELDAAFDLREIPAGTYPAPLRPGANVPY